MWTYKNPYRVTEISGKYIQERAKVALSRALSVDRLVVFAGSGIAVANGQISWNKLVSNATNIAKENDEIENVSSGARKTALKTMANQEEYASQIKDAKPIQLEIAEQYAQLAGRTEKLRYGLAALFGHSEDKGASARVETLAKNNGNLKKKHGQLGSKAEALNKLVAIDLDRCDPIGKLVHDLNIRRFITLNYDVEIERTFRRQFRVRGARSKELGSDFEILCNGVDGTEDLEHKRILNLKDRVEYRDGTTRSVSSVCLSGSNIGDLVNFSMFSSQYVGQVFHLHGRYDKPDSIVLSESDYQNTYFKSHKHRRAFEEAFSALFSGNDVLFVGLGMQEEEVLQPLRRFISNEQMPDFAKRHTFSLMPRDVTINEDGLRINNEQTSFNAKERDQAQDESQQQRLHTKYGVYTLLYGGEDYRSILQLVQLISLGTAQSGREGEWVYPFDRGYAPAKIAGAILDIITKLNLRKTASEEQNSNGRYLLRNDEFESLVALGETCAARLIAKGFIPSQISALVSDLRDRTYSLALEQEFDRINKKKQDWWHDWRIRPEERQAIFAPIYPEDMHKCYARHQAYYDHLPNDFEGHEFQKQALEKTKSLFPVISTLRKIGRSERIIQQPAGAKRPVEDDRKPEFSIENTRVGSRILRATLPRGKGKGSLLNLLSQRVPDSERKAQGWQPDPNGHLYLDTLFEKDEAFRYSSSFVLHLSYSMEFSSVISALSDFFQKNIVTAVEQNLSDYPDPLKKNDKGLERVVGTYGEDHQIVRFLEDFGARISSMGPKTDTFEVVQNFFEEHVPLFGPGRAHRLERLRARMWAYTYVADVFTEKNLRLFIGISGLDKLCNSRGSAHNPMYRALFRMLTACGLKYEHESDTMLPVDFFLLSGSKMPLRYLTEELTHEQVIGRLARPDPFSGHFASYFEYQRIDKASFGKNWPVVPGFGLHERFWVEQRKEKSLLFALDKEVGKTRRVQFNHPFGAIKREWENSVALHAWCEGVWNASQSLEETDPDPIELLKTLDASASRGGQQMVVEAILSHHRYLLRRVNKDFINKGSILDQTASDPSNLVGNELTELTYVLLAHLALYPMPVEMRVLYGCQHVRELLHRVVSQVKKVDDDIPHFRRIRRTRSLKILKLVFDYLDQTKLVIRVKRKANIRAGSNLDAESQVHDRFIIQHQLRSIAAKEMDLSVPDQGEHNYFQVSIYPDQPRDLPTPRQDHYEMVRDVFDNQIKDVRHTVWCLMQLERQIVRSDKSRHKSGTISLYETDGSARPPFDFLSDGDRDLLRKGLERRLINVTGESKDRFDTDLASIHAVSQRIRALYGMLRSGFTVGTISRLSGIDTGIEPDQPYERFRGWLRGLTNAAIGLDKVERSLQLLTATDMGDVQELKAICLELDKWLQELDTHPDQLSVRKILLGDKTPYKGLSDDARQNLLWANLKEERGMCLPPPKPLYRDEIGWLMNERGLLSLVQGHLFDAIPLFNRALNTMYHQGKESGNDPALHAAVRRVRFNRALTLIQRGHLERAAAEFEDLVLPDEIASHSGSQISWLSRGYVHLVDFYGGDLNGVEAGFDNLLKQAGANRIVRVSGIFHRHYAQYFMKTGNFDGASDHLKMAIGSAEQSEQRDILHLAEVATVRLEFLRSGGVSKQSARYLQNAAKYGREMGFPRLEASALRMQGDIQLAANDDTAAGENVSLAAAIANRCGLRLEKLEALLTYAEVLIVRGQDEQAFEMLTEISRDSERHNYQLISGRIRQLKGRLLM